MSEKLLAWYRSTFAQAMIGGIVLWAALPPLNLWPLAWIAPVWWIVLVHREKLPSLQTTTHLRLRPWLLLLAAVLYFLAGLAINDWFHSQRYNMYWLAETVYWVGLLAIVVTAARLWAARPYRCLWLAGTFFWLATLHWLRLPHWSVGLGWLAAGIYFGCYLPVFVGLSRVAVYRLRLPLILAAPAVYAGLELAQAYLLSGMTMGCLEHSQYRWTRLIQISDLTGCYGVTFVMMFVAACLACMLPCDSRRWTWWPLVPAAGIMAVVLAYGYYRTANVETEPGLKIALIQGDIDVQLDNDDGFCDKVYAEYHDLTRDALKDRPPVDLIVWPETVFCHSRWLWTTGDANAVALPDFPSPQAFHKWLDSWKTGTCREMTETAREFGLPMIVGINRQHFGARGRQIFNSAVLITPDGKWCEPGRLEQSYYDKMHLVPFGEYMPFVEIVPWLQSLSPLGSSSSSGGKPKGLMLNGICLAPNICYETVLPHVIREQLTTLRLQGQEPQILVNVTNDGWFWGSSELEMHLACGVFRTVECRRPMVIAANTGISASIDGNGRIQGDQGPLRKPFLILADVRLDRRESWYLRHGDWFAGVCLAATLVLACIGVSKRKAVGRKGPGQNRSG